MDATDFNHRPADEARALLTACADVPAWADGVLAARPYVSVAAVLHRADALARRWSDADVERALAQHPRLGERATGDEAQARLSAGEQSGLATDAATRERLRNANAAYEARFDRVFLLHAAGRSADDVLLALENRLDNDPETERAVVAGELRAIALHRLEDALADPETAA